MYLLKLLTDNTIFMKHCKGKSEKEEIGKRISYCSNKCLLHAMRQLILLLLTYSLLICEPVIDNPAGIFAYTDNSVWACAQYLRRYPCCPSGFIFGHAIKNTSFCKAVLNLKITQHLCYQVLIDNLLCYFICQSHIKKNN
jgi:hypothetical protein